MLTFPFISFTFTFSLVKEVNVLKFLWAKGPNLSYYAGIFCLKFPQLMLQSVIFVNSWGPFATKFKLQNIFMVVLIVFQHLSFTPKLECTILKMSGHANLHLWLQDLNFSARLLSWIWFSIQPSSPLFLPWNKQTSLVEDHITKGPCEDWSYIPTIEWIPNKLINKWTNKTFQRFRSMIQLTLLA